MGDNGFPPADMRPERIRANEQMGAQMIAAGLRQGRCSVCGRVIVGTGKRVWWRPNIYGEPTWPFCEDAKECSRYQQFLRKHVSLDDCPVSYANPADPMDYCPN